jgi:hypothetical protein
MPGSQGLVGHWKLDETSGTTAVDSSGNGNNGTMQDGLDAGIDSVAGKVATGLEFEATNQDVNISDNDIYSIDTTNELTVSVWASFDAKDATRKAVVSKGAGGAYEWEIRATTTDKICAYMSNTSGTNYLVSCTQSTYNADQWYHIVATFDLGSDWSNLYVDGNFVDSATSPSNPPPVNGSAALRFGERADGAEDLSGKGDEVRIYDRVLSAAEIKALYQDRAASTATAGQMVYDSKHYRIAYCDGTNWVHAGIGSYNPSAVYFDGTNDYLLRGTTLTGAPDATKFWTTSFWIRRHDAAGNSGEIYDTGTAGGADIDILFEDPVDHRIRWIGRGAAGTAVNIHANAITDTDWHNVLFSVDLNTGDYHVYTDDVSDVNTATTVDTTRTIDFSSIEQGFGANSSGGGDLAKYDIADFWMSFDDYINFSIEANRRKFISANGMPKYLGPDGSIPTGSAPDIFLTGDVIFWQSNKGTGGDFTENGEITYSSSQPGDISSINLSSGLVLHFPMDETTGTTITDTISSKTGTMQGGLDAGNDSVPGRIGNALDFDGVDDYIDVASPNLPINDFTYAFWINADTTNDEAFIMVSDGAGNNEIVIYIDPQLKGNVEGGGFLGGNANVSASEWVHLVMSRSGSDVTFYINGAVDSTATRAGVLDFSTCPLLVGVDADSGCTGLLGNYANSRIDDVRVYDRALNNDEVAALYNIDTIGTPGQMQYNADFNVMEYFNGAEWVAMGPVGGTPPSSGLVGHWKLDESGNTSTAVDSAGSSNGTLINFPADPTPNWQAAKIANGLNFDGVNDEVDIPSSAALTPADAFTFAAWVYPTTDNTDVAIFMGPEGNGFGESWRMVIDSSPEFAFSVDTNNALVSVRNGDPALDKWQHVAGVYDGANIHLFVDGVLLESVAQTGSVTYPQAGKVARMGRADGVPWLEGAIDDVRIYDRALTQQEIQQLYYYGLSGGIGDVNNGCSNAGSINGATAEGIMLYNTDQNFMQYCNGESWIGIGK